MNMTISSSVEKTHVVILDDDPTYRALLTALLATRPELQVSCVPTSLELEGLLAVGNVDCVLLDYDLGDENAFQVRERLAERFADLPPVLLLTGDERQGTAIKAFRLGIGDFVPKRGLSASGLASSIASVRLRDKTDKKLKSELLHHVRNAVRDPVTGLATRATLDARLASVASAKPGSYSLVTLEVVAFAFVVQTAGASGLDDALRQFAGRLQAALRPGDICGRYAGNTFLVIVDRLTQHALDGLRDRLASACTFRLDLPAVSVDLVPSVCEIGSVAEIHRVGTEFTHTARNESFGSLLGDVGDGQPSYPANADPTRTSDRRRDPRQRVLKRGQIVVEGTVATIDCTVRNLSKGGAGIKLEAAVAAPAVFQLRIAGAASRKATVRWQVGQHLGVEFIE